MALGTKRKASNALAQFPVNFPSGTIIAFGGATAPEGWVLCDGSTLNRTTYSALYSAIGNAWGSGDGSSTFHLPDLRGKFLRGRVNINTVTGSGTAATNNATFTAHGVNRTGFKVRLSSGTLTGLAVSTDYYAIVVDSNTLAFATSKANALAGTKIAISGTNTAVITQYEDPDASSRTISSTGGNSGNNIGASQEDAVQGHRHGSIAYNGAGNVPYGLVSAASMGLWSPANNSTTLVKSSDPVADSSSGGPRNSAESRPQNSLVNYIIKL